ncbi:PREDICTED: piriformospora indica-insensitive protein 2-like [Camelina sativa]|uniref:Piriformospora indica-insensitive protein 2-like n=1 Tax=Camelina sativa TaxID=90675 RepID=A0ABM0UXY9_CAMSA|nr:PREDICTED: piriformospora indica-insensitive protein 2-like [Camelina sativa]
MASSRPTLSLLLLLLFLFTATIITTSHQTEDDDDSSSSSPQLALNPSEQEAVYRVLDSVNSAISWRTIFPDDLCASPPDGVVCDYLYVSQNGVATSVHVTELHLGYLSDYTQNPPCSSNSTLDPLLFTSFKHLRKLFVYKCFTVARVSLPDSIPEGFGSVLEELVFIENPSLVGEIGAMIGNFTKLRRLVLTGNGFHGSIPGRIGDLASLEEVTLSRNRLSGGFPTNATSRLKNLKVLDFSHNFLNGNAPDSIGDLTELLKLDLSFNEFTGEIPSTVGKLKKLVFLDLSYNRFGNFGVPLFLAEMPRLREVHLSGNKLGGRIPLEIWKNLKGLSGIGLSRMGLQGNIPASMASSLKNLCFIALDNNNLDGEIPEEFGRLEFVGEINFENNNLIGKAPFADSFRDRVGRKLKLSGNPSLHYGKRSDPPVPGPALSSSAATRLLVCFPVALLALYISMKQ